MKFIINGITTFVEYNLNVKLNKWQVIVLLLLLLIVYVALVLASLSLFTLVDEWLLYFSFMFNKASVNIFNVLCDNCNFFNDFWFALNPNFDLDISVNTDFENSLNVCNDCIEIIHQDSYFLFSRVFLNLPVSSAVFTVYFFFKMLKGLTVFFFKNWKK